MVNGNFTDWFDIKSGLKQVYVLSPLLFNIFINNLVDEAKKWNVVTNVNGENIGILLYADDAVFLFENENDLQKMFEFVV